MLSDEEKKAIKEVKHFNQLTRYWQEEEYEEKEIAGYIGIILNLIEKQSKEIEELNDKIKAKIEPVLKQLERKMEEEYNKYGNSREYQDVVDAYNFLQSLLEKE